MSVVNTTFAIDLIVNAVCDTFKIDKELMLKNRTTESREPRQIAMYLCRKTTNYSLDTIGNYFNRDHATVLHAVKTIENTCFSNRSSKLVIDDLLVTCKHILGDKNSTGQPYLTEIVLEKGKRIILVGFSEFEVKQFKTINQC